MKVFISWSGERSRAVAQALRQWLPDVIQSVEPWMSAEDIEAGARWGKDISDQLEQTRFGIICVTPENQHAPWILFEAGALAKTLEDTYVCPYLIGLSPTQLQAGPLTQFQAKQANESQTWELVRTVNRALDDSPLSEDRLRKIFEKWWPELDGVLENLPAEATNQEVKRPLEDMMAEVLELVRQMSRSTPSPIIFPADTNQAYEDLVEKIEKTLNTLSPKEERVLRMLLGLGSESRHSYEEVGKMFGVSSKEIRSIEAQALRKLKHPSKHHELFDKIEEGSTIE